VAPRALRAAARLGERRHRGRRGAAPAVSGSSRRSSGSKSGASAVRSQLSTSHCSVSVKAPPFRAATARSADGSAEPLRQLAEKFLLIFTDPRYVAVRPQQHGGHVQFLADVDDVVDPICPARRRKPAGLVEE